MASTLPPLGGRQDWAAMVALDWADEKHVWCLQAQGEEKREYGEVESSPEAIDRWVASLRARFGEQPIAVCLEQTRGALVYQLGKYPQLILFPAPPAMVANVRRAFRPSGAKDDPGDADLLLTILQRHGEELRMLTAEDELTRGLRLEVEARRNFVDERTRESNRLTSCLKMYYPQMLAWFSDITGPRALAFLQKLPNLELAQHAHPGTLHQLLGGRKDKLQDRMQAVYAAVPATRDGAIVKALQRQAVALAKIIQSLNEVIQEYESSTNAYVAVHPDREIFASLPAAGPVTVSRMIAAMGTDRTRFADASQLQAYVGVAPVTERSGKSKWVHVRRGCPKFLRQTFHEYAALSIRKSRWAATFYAARIAKGEPHHAAVRALAFKWCRILFRCWQTHTPYDDQRYVEALSKRNSPLASIYHQFEWQKKGGFYKLSPKNA